VPLDDLLEQRVSVRASPGQGLGDSGLHRLQAVELVVDPCGNGGRRCGADAVARPLPPARGSGRNSTPRSRVCGPDMERDLTSSGKMSMPRRPARRVAQRTSTAIAP
jgi:hypothetical protein